MGTPVSAAQQRLGQMFERHAGVIRRTLQSRGVSPDAADDATQQAFLVASQRLDDIRPGRERAFLFAVVFRLTRSKHRRTARYQFEADMDLRAAENSTADAPTERVLALQLINRVLEKLDRDLMQAFLLFELEQLSTSEVALQLGIPSGTAASRRRRARETLEATLTRLEPARLRGPGRSSSQNSASQNSSSQSGGSPNDLAPGNGSPNDLAPNDIAPNHIAPNDISRSNALPSGVSVRGSSRSDSRRKTMNRSLESGMGRDLAREYPI